MKGVLNTACIVSVLLGMNAHAVVIEYEVTELGGDSFRYDYTITNDGSITNNLELFGINFDPTLYDEFSLLPDLTGEALDNWDGTILGSGIGLPAAFDLFAFGPGLATGDTLSGVGIEFTWIGLDLPGSQDFEVFDSFTFDFLGGGFSELRVDEGPIAVPEPPMWTLLMAGLGLLRMRKKS